jgi:hypothetical protein
MGRETEVATDLLTAGAVGLGVGIGIVLGVGILRLVRRWLEQEDPPRKT